MRFRWTWITSLMYEWETMGKVEFVHGPCPPPCISGYTVQQVDFDRLHTINAVIKSRPV